MKLKIFTVLFLAAFCLSACSKEYTCECVITTTFPNEAPTTSVSTQTFSEKSEKKAKSSCESTQTTSHFGMTQTAVCKLK